MQNPEFKLRPALSAEIPRLAAFNHTVKSDYVWQLNLNKEEGEIKVELREVRLPRPVQVQYPRDQFSLADEWKKNAQTFVAVAGGAPLGYIRVLEQESAGSVWILDLVVETEARRKGVATALIHKIEQWARERRNRQLFIEMSSKNHPIIGLVKKMGFEFSGYNDHYYFTQDVALFFGKLLKEF